MAHTKELTKHEEATVNAQLVPDAAKSALQEFWKRNSKHIASVTAGNDVERVMRVTYSLLYRNPKLIQCTPFSLLNGIVLAHQMGLIFGTQEVSLVPFGNEATLIIGYQGKVKLALASGLIKSVQADCVLDGDQFQYSVSGRGVKFSHVPEWKNRPLADESNTLGAYSQLVTSTGGVQTKFVPLAEILDARSRSRGYNYQVKKGGTDNPWMTAFGVMAMKTAVHRGMKLAPQDARLALANAVDDEEQGGSAVIADGLDPSQFTLQETVEPLVQTGAEAAQAVAQDKIAAAEKRRSQPPKQPFQTDPARTYRDWDAWQACGQDFSKEQIWVGGTEYRINDSGSYSPVKEG